MESSHDSIKYVEPRYTNAMRNDFDWDLQEEPGAWNMDNRFDDPSHNHDVMYESFESRYATELVNVADDKVVAADNKLKVSFEGGPLAHYIFGNAVIYVIGKDGVRKACAMQEPAKSTPDQAAGRIGSWMGGSDIELDENVYLQVSSISEVGGVATAAIKMKYQADGAYDNATVEKQTDGKFKLTFTTGGDTKTTIVEFKAVARFDSEKDLTGKYLGEVEITMRDYHFRPRPISLGVTWTQMTELVLDTSFGISTEEILLDYASQEIKKALDFQSIKYASDVQKTYASDNFVKFNAAYASSGTGTKDSYWHQAQLIGQAIGHVEDNMLNKFNRGGVTAIVGGTDACRYLELNEGWSNKGAQPKIGAHKVGELNGKNWNAVVKVA